MVKKPSNDPISSFETLVETYVKNNIKEPWKSESKKFFYPVAKKISIITATWLDVLRNKAKEDFFKHEIHSTIKLLNDQKPVSYYLDKEALELITAYFSKQHDIKIEYWEAPEKNKPNSLCNNVFKNGGEFSLRCYWTPENNSLSSHPFIYEKHFPIPSKGNAELYECAKKGNGTDLLLRSRSKKSIPVHSLILKLKSPYFKQLLENSPTEFLKISYSTKLIQAMVEFLYLNRLYVEFSDDDLFNLLEMSKKYQINDLFKHTIDLINNYFESKDINALTVIRLIKAAELYQVDDFLILSLKQAENLEDFSRPNEVVDWKLAPKSLYAKLLTLTIRKGHHKIEQKLSQLITNELTKT